MNSQGSVNLGQPFIACFCVVEKASTRPAAPHAYILGVGKWGADQRKMTRFSRTPTMGTLVLYLR